MPHDRPTSTDRLRGIGYYLGAALGVVGGISVAWATSSDGFVSALTAMMATHHGASLMPGFLLVGGGWLVLLTMLALSKTRQDQAEWQPHVESKDRYVYVSAIDPPTMTRRDFP